MKNSFKVERLTFRTIQELPNSWTEKHYKDLLEAMEYADISEIPHKELKEMCLMSLNDFEPEEAAKIVLNYVFHDRLKNGQILNLSNEMLDEKMWEEYADLALHEDFFKVNQLLYQAFDGLFPLPEALHFQVRINTNEKDGLSIFHTYPEATLIRLLVAGMPENTLIFRLFEEQVASREFKDAKDIIWQLKTEKTNANELVFDIVSSSYWFHDFRYVTSYEATTHDDEV